ncbi:MAG: potassium-transporting ATPase subunit KdpA [Candidatus Margulisbacteria bacterium]|nr:potassium-transporting ATPase subunit KdpA [Candidatus Margulisiibacteriota bacterium]
MKITDFIQIGIYIAVLVFLTPLLGTYMARVFEGRIRAGQWLEKSIYRVCGIDENEEMDWLDYTKAVLFFNLLGFIFLFLVQIFQSYLPLNLYRLPNVPWDLAFNTAMSFMTNTNWQSYSGETTLSYLTQMLGLTVQNFLSAATGIAVFLALVRGLTNRSVSALGNFWVNTVHSLVYILIPLSIIVAILLASQGVVQTFNPYKEIKSLQGEKIVLPLGPAASQIAIKQLGTNGGGYFGANSTHPFENPTPLSNFLEMLSILLIPAALTYTYGVLIKNKKHGWLLFIVMMLLWGGGLAVSLWSEYSSAAVPLVTALEGQETRFGVTNSLIWATATTAASNGSVNAMHSSLSPLAGGVALFNMMLGEIVFGGVGAGMYGMLLFVLMTVFLAGLMVGRTPEYLGKKIEQNEIKMVILAILLPSVVVLIGAGFSCVLPVALASLGNKGPHGLSEILYAFTSAANNNGSAFAGLSTNTLYYILLLGLAMLIGRFGVIIPCLVIAGSLAIKKIAPPSAGTFSTDNTLFAALLVGVIMIVGALTFFPSLCLGPIIEHLLMLKGHVF